MKKYKLENFTRGWVVGDFEPNIIRTKDFEVMVRYYKKGDKEAKHVHKLADEITIIVSGKFLMNGELLEAGDIIHLSPNDPTDFECLEDGSNTVIKTPSVMGDKYLIN
jgi:quercetin dioxygenase-like cupin family protein